MYEYTQTDLLSECAALRPVASRDVRAHRMDGEVVLYREADGRTFHLNETACTLWEACDGTRTVDQLGDVLAQTYDVDGARALDDAEQIVAQLAEAGLLTVGNSRG